MGHTSGDPARTLAADPYASQHGALCRSGTGGVSFRGSIQVASILRFGMLFNWMFLLRWDRRVIFEMYRIKTVAGMAGVFS